MTILVLLLASLLLPACQRGSEEVPDGPVEWKVALEEIEGSVQDVWAQRFKKKIESATAGKVAVTVYPYGALGTSDQLTELVRNGALQMAMASPGHLGKLIPETQIFLLHFVFSEDNAVNQQVLRRDGRLRARFDGLYEKKGLRLLSFFPEGWQVWTTRKPVRTPADLAGLKMRVMTSPLLVEAYQAYGANPTPLPYSEVYSALQLGMIDGQVNPLFAIEEMSFYELTDILTFPRHSQFVTSVVANPAFLAGLSPEHRTLVEETAAALEGEIFEVQRELNAARLEIMRKKKPRLEIVHLDEAERAAFRRASLPVRQTYVEMVGPRGQELLNLLLEDVETAVSTRELADQSSTKG